MSGKTPKKRSKWRNIFIGLIILIVVGLIAGRIYLPIWLKDYVNKELGAMEAYKGSVEDIDVTLLRGGYIFKGLKIVKRIGASPSPFVEVKNIDATVQWGALFKGRIVSDIHIEGAEVNFAYNKSGKTVQTGEGGNWTEVLQDLIPIDINVVTLNNSKISYKDFSSTPNVDVYVQSISGEIRNLRNVEDKNNARPSSFYATGTTIGKGSMRLDGSINILKKNIDLQTKLKIEKMNLTAINSYSMAYAAVDFESGTLSNYAVLDIKDGRISGYFKPIANNLRMIDKSSKDKNLFEAIWEPVAAFFVEVFSNQSQDQFATRIPFEGRIDNVETPFWPTVGGILRNAFVKAFSHKITDVGADE